MLKSQRRAFRWPNNLCARLYIVYVYMYDVYIVYIKVFMAFFVIFGQFWRCVESHKTWLIINMILKITLNHIKVHPTKNGPAVLLQCAINRSTFVSANPFMYVYNVYCIMYTAYIRWRSCDFETFGPLLYFIIIYSCSIISFKRIKKTSKIQDETNK